MIQRVYKRAVQARLVDDVVVATDDSRIERFCLQQGIPCALTSPDHGTGTDRLAEVATQRQADIYVNVQGDEPLIEPESIDAVTRCLLENIPNGTGVSTGYINHVSAAGEQDTSVVHLVPALDGHVLYFSRLPVPCAFRQEFQRTSHVGLYAFTPEALGKFAAWEMGPVEKAESIELMRFLEHGERIACTTVAPGSVGVDTPEDVALVERILASGPDQS